VVIVESIERGAPLPRKGLRRGWHIRSGSSVGGCTSLPVLLHGDQFDHIHAAVGCGRRRSERGDGPASGSRIGQSTEKESLSESHGLRFSVRGHALGCAQVPAPPSISVTRGIDLARGRHMRMFPPTISSARGEENLGIATLAEQIGVLWDKPELDVVG
jgi:hypothetical protein